MLGDYTFHPLRFISNHHLNLIVYKAQLIIGVHFLVLLLIMLFFNILLCTIYVYDVHLHSCPQSPRSFCPVAGIESSGLVQHLKSAIHGLPFKSGKSDWFRTRNAFSAHTQKIGSSQSSRSLPQARRVMGSGDKNGALYEELFVVTGILIHSYIPQTWVLIICRNFSVGMTIE